MEGYFQTFSQDPKGVASVHPRLGCELQRLPAPLPVFAFCEAFRRANASIFIKLASELRRHPTAASLAAVLERQAHFADLSVQIHWGDEVSNDHVAWHVDAPNSFLHLALGLQGLRVLHARCQLRRGSISQNCAIGCSDAREELPQAQGAAYLSSPCCFPHAVQYPAVNWTSRIIAVQCRLLLSEEELFGSLNGRHHTALDMDPQGGTAAVVFRTLAEVAENGGLNMPRLDAVQSVYSELVENQL